MIGYHLDFGDYVNNFNINGNQTFYYVKSDKVIK